MLINKELLDTLTTQAKASSRLRMHYDLRDSVDDESQRMLNAIEPGTVIPIHRHNTTSEDVIILRGKGMEIFYDDDGRMAGRFLLVPDGECPAIHVPIGQYHSLISLESGTVVMEFKNTRYDSFVTEDYLMNNNKKV